MLIYIQVFFNNVPETRLQQAGFWGNYWRRGRETTWPLNFKYALLVNCDTMCVKRMVRFRKLFFVAAVGIFSCLSVGDSARSLRSRRNGVHCRAREGGKRRAAEETVPIPENSSPPPFFFPFCPPRARHHSASDDRNWRNLLRSTTNFPKTTQTEHAKLQ